MKFKLLLLVILLALLPAPATANWKDMVDTIDKVFPQTIAGLVEENFEDKVEIGKGATARFIKPKEEADGALPLEEPPTTGTITKMYKVKSRCYHANKDLTFEPDFCYQVLIKPAVADKISNSKSKMFTVVLHISNSVVVSRIKITLASGTGNKVIRDMVYRGVMSFVSKCDQTLSTLKVFKQTLDVQLPTIIENIAKTISAHTAPTTFKIKSFKPIFGRSTKSAFTTKLFEESKEPGEKIDEAVEENAPIFKLFNELKESQRFPDSNEEIPAEFVAFGLTQKEVTGDYNQAFENFVKHVYLIIANFGGKLSVHVRSDIFAFSKDLPVATKELLLITTQRLLERAIVETFVSFYNLDRTVPEGMPENSIVEWFRSIMGSMASPVPFKEEGAETNHYIADFVKYKIQIRGYVIGGHGDFMVRVLLNKEGEAVLDRVNYFPLKSQYILAPLVYSFIQKTCHEFYEAIYAGMVIPDSNEHVSNEETSKQLLDGNSIMPENLRKFYQSRIELGIFLSHNKVMPFVLSIDVQKAIDQSILLTENSGGVKYIKYRLGDVEVKSNEKVIKTIVQKKQTVAFESEHLTEIEQTIVKEPNGQIQTFTKSETKSAYSVPSRAEETLTYVVVQE